MTKLTMRNGKEIEIRAVSSYLISSVRQKTREDFEAEHGSLTTAPTYDVEMGGGLPGLDAWAETFEYTAETIQDAPSDAQHAWAEYQQAQKDLFGMIWLRTSRVHLLEGVVTEPPDDGWLERQQKHGAKTPIDPDDLKVHWIETELVINPHELGMLVSTIQAQGNAVEVARQTAADMFQRAMG